MNLGILEASLNIVQEVFGDLLLENIAKAIEKWKQLLAWGAASPCAKSSSNQELEKIY